MKSFRWLLLPAAASLIVGACSGLSEAMSAHTDTVARASGAELKVEDAAQLLAAEPSLPADPQVVRAIADAWVDYTLLATAITEDSTLAALNLDAFVQPVAEQTMMLKLRDEVIHPDTTFTDQQIDQLWKTEGPGIEIHARHILLRVQPDATPAQRDSVKAVAESIRQRAVDGQDFAALATQYSQDPGTAQNGGDLGFFGRGHMVASFEDAAFKLQPGEISPVVESPFGYHIIQVLDRRQPDLATQRDDFRTYLVQKAQQEAETAYLDSLSDAADVQVQPSGLAIVREIASRPETSLRGRAADREISTYKGGSFTAGEFLDFIRGQNPQAQNTFATAPDDQLENYIQQLTRKELLLRAAKEHDFTLSGAEEDSIRSQARQAMLQMVRASGLDNLARETSTPEEIGARVAMLLHGAITGQVQLVSLGRLGYALRDLYHGEVNEGTFAQVVDEMKEIRASQPTPTQPAPVPDSTASAQPSAAPDSAR